MNAELARGVRAMLPILFGVVPLGMVVGVEVAESDVNALAGWATGLTIYGGSAQLATIDLLDAGAAPIVVIATVLAINARLLLYGGSMAAHWRGTSRAWRALAGYLLVDPSFAVGMDRYEQCRRPVGHAYYLGAAAVLWVSWQLAIGLGLTLGPVVPPVLELQFVVPLFLVAIVVPEATTPPARAAAGVGAVAALAGSFLPLHAGLIVGIAAGIAAGVVAGQRKEPAAQ